MALRSTLDIIYNANNDLSGVGFSITPVSINHNSLLATAIKRNDVAALRQLFTAGLARPSDHVIGLLDQVESFLEVRSDPVAYGCVW